MTHYVICNNLVIIVVIVLQIEFDVTVRTLAFYSVKKLKQITIEIIFSQAEIMRYFFSKFQIHKCSSAVWYFREQNKGYGDLVLLGQSNLL